MAQEPHKPFGSEEVPYVELRDEKGKRFSPPGINVHSRLIRFEGDEVVVRVEGMGDAVVVGPGGRTVRRVAAFPRPGSQQAASFTRAVGGGTFSLEGAGREVLFTTRLFQHDIGRNAPSSVQWSPTGKRLAAGGYKMLAVIGFEDKTILEWPAPGGIEALTWLDEERIAALHTGQLVIRNVRDGAQVAEHTDTGLRSLNGFTASPDRRDLLSGGPRLLRAPADELQRAAPVELPGADPKAWVTVCGFEPSGLALLVSSGKQLFRLAWPDLSLLEVIAVPFGLEAAAMSTAGDRIVAAGWCTVQFFARGAEGPRHYDMPSFGTRSVAAARRGQRGKFPKTLKALEKRIAAMQPFSQLGEPLPYDKYLVRVSAFTAWGGPESAEDEPLGQQVATWQRVTKEAIQVGKKDVAPIRPLVAKARELAEQRIQLTPEEVDDHYAPRYSALLYFEEIVELVATFLFLEAKLPDDLKELFLLFEAGHWPCGYQVGPDSDDDEPEKLIVC